MGWGRKQESRISLVLRDLSHYLATEKRGLRTSVNIEVCIKGGRELRNLIVALSCIINKRLDCLIRMRRNRRARDDDED